MYKFVSLHKLQAIPSNQDMIVYEVPKNHEESLIMAEGT